MILKDYEPHPTQQIFKKHRTPTAKIALTLGYSYSHVQNVLYGYTKATPNMHAGLVALADWVQEHATDEPKRKTR